MDRLIVICFMIIILTTGCNSNSASDELTNDNHISEDKSESDIENEQFVFTDQIISVKFKDGRTGEVYNIEDDSLVEFSNMFNGCTFISNESTEDSTGYIYWVTITTDAGKIEYSSASDVSVYENIMSFVSYKRYSTIETFLKEYKNATNK